MFGKFLILLLSATINCEPWSTSFKLKSMDKQLILDLHNWYRAQISRGDIFQQPESSDMTVVEWDDRLAEIALIRAQKCLKEKKVNDYEISSFQHDLLGRTAINEYFTNDTDNYTKKAVHSWFKNHINFEYENGTCTKSDCQSYKNMIFSNVFVLGCEAYKCVNSISVICIYSNSERTDKGEYLYKSGLSCTSCPQDYSFCMDGSLCASKFHCRDSKISKTCRCLVLPKLCTKHGDYDSSKCRCRCQPGWTGLNCEKPCHDSSPLCENRKWACTDVTQKSQMFKACPQTCKWCQNNPNSIPIYNENEIKVNTIYDPTNFELEDQSDGICKDNKMECGAWASKGFCNLESVKRVCKLTCKVCEGTQGRVITTQKSMNCEDHPTCVPEFQPYCNIMIQISLKCPKLCGRCTATSSSTLKSSSTVSTSTIKKEFVDCLETWYRKETCISIAMANLCYKPDMQEHCPITCRHPACRKPSPSTQPTTTKTTPAKTTTTFMSSTVPESKVCKFLPCNEPGVPSFCQKKCSGISTSTVNPMIRESYEYCNIYPCSVMFVRQTCKKCFDPEICVSLDCNYNGVQKLCKNKCQTSTSMSSTAISSSSTKTPTKSTDSPLCVTLPCGFPDVEKMCPNKCSKSTTMFTSTTQPKSSKISTSMQSSTTLIDSPLCISLPCSIPRIELLCPTKCGSTSVKSTTVISTSPSSDSPLCKSLPCEIQKVKEFCPQKCGSTSTMKSTSILPTDLPICITLPCHIPQFQLICPMKCHSMLSPTTSATKLSTSISSSTKSTDPPFCVMLPCDVPQVQLACPLKCLSSSSKGSTTALSTKSTDPEFCVRLTCDMPQVPLLCIKKCGSTTPKLTSALSTKSTDSVLCSVLSCGIPQVSKICPNKCSSTTVKMTTSVLTTQKTDAPLCTFVICGSSGAKAICPQKCLSTSSPSSSPKTTKSTDSPVCAFFACDMPKVPIVCPNKCASTTSKTSSTMTTASTVKSSSITSTKSTDPEICQTLPCSIAAIQAICPKKCSSSTAKSSSTVSVTTKSTDHPLCIVWPCSHKVFTSLCPNKCSSTTVSLSTSTFKPTDPSFCSNFPCEFPQVKIFCPLKCGKMTSIVTSTTSKASTLSTGTKPTDFPMCIFVSCDSIEALMACPVKCSSSSILSTTKSSTASTTTVMSSTMSETDNPICAQLPCSNAGVQALCKKKCEDKPICKSLPCSNAGVRQLCTIKCADYKTTKSSTLASLVSSTLKSTDPAFCSVFSCNIQGMSYACPNRCGIPSSKAKRL